MLFSAFFFKIYLTYLSKNVARPLNINTFQGGNLFMAGTFLHDLKQTLDNCISTLYSIHDLFCIHPGKDFSRDRKITFPLLCNALIQMQSKSLPNEVLDFWNHSLDAPTSSAFIQQREKILPEAFDFLFHLFCDETLGLQDRLHKGYRLVAADGSDADIYRNPNDGETFIHEGEKGYNAIHINACYDLLNHTYVDVLFQGKKKLHERAAFNCMVERSRLDNVIYIADRGYESFNTFAHVIRSGQKFIIRMKDISSNGILSSYDLPDSAFDERIETTLTRRHTKETLSSPDTYTILPASTDFDFLDDGCRYYPISFRIVRFLTDAGTYVCVATNLPPDEFPLEEIRELYRLRWGEESSFRELKYTVGLVNFHSRKKDLVCQEIYARLILYNFCELITQHVAVVTSKETKHDHKINFSTAVNICRAYLKDGGEETEMYLLIQRHLTPIRNDRKYALKLRPKRNRDFVYRAA